jgi:hypothetical protein
MSDVDLEVGTPVSRSALLAEARRLDRAVGEAVFDAQRWQECAEALFEEREELAVTLRARLGPP